MAGGLEADCATVSACGEKVGRVASVPPGQHRTLPLECDLEMKKKEERAPISPSPPSLQVTSLSAANLAGRDEDSAAMRIDFEISNFL